MAGSEDEYCDMTDMLKSGCDHCKNGDTQILDRDLVRTRMPKAVSDFVVAEYQGECQGGCGDQIIPGDHIAVISTVEDGRGNVIRKNWAHYGCTQ